MVLGKITELHTKITNDTPKLIKEKLETLDNKFKDPTNVNRALLPIYGNIIEKIEASFTS